MQSVQRQFGKYMKRTADEQQISVLLKDFEEADQLLGRVCHTPVFPTHKMITADAPLAIDY